MEENIRPFVIEEGLDVTRYRMQVTSKSKNKYYEVRAIQWFDTETGRFMFDFECNCQGFYFRRTCSHCRLLDKKLREYGEVDES